MGDGLNLDPWWDEPAYKAAQVSFSAKGAFILAKLQAHDAGLIMVQRYSHYRPKRAVDATARMLAARPASPQAPPTPITRVSRNA